MVDSARSETGLIAATGTSTTSGDEPSSTIITEPAAVHPHNTEQPAIESPPAELLPAYEDVAGEPRRPVVPVKRLQYVPALVICPFCDQQGTTRIEHEYTSLTCLSSIAFGFCCILCVCLPFLAKSCCNVDHYCSKCNQKLAHAPYQGPTQVVKWTPPPPAYDMENPGRREAHDIALDDMRRDPPGSPPAYDAVTQGADEAQNDSLDDMMRRETPRPPPPAFGHRD